MPFFVETVYLFSMINVSLLLQENAKLLNFTLSAYIKRIEKLKRDFVRLNHSLT